MLSVVSIVVSLAGLFYKREELKRLFKDESKMEKAQREMIDHMVEAERQRISKAEKRRFTSFKIQTNGSICFLK